MPDLHNSIKSEILRQITNLNLNSWETTLKYVKNLPYGRNANRWDFSLVLTEQQGTCSSKHALLKTIADINNLPNVSLILGIYKMNNINTPKIGNIITRNTLNYIPEAHCYLKVNNKRIDATLPNSNFNNIEDDILLEKEITPEQVSEFKIEFHKNYLKQWIIDEHIPFTFNEIWTIREQCISALSQK